MRDDIQFNIEFCEEIQIYGNIYDYKRSDYCNRSAQDQAWEKIASKFKASVQECKERWKNIRGSYSKYKAKMQTKSGQGVKRVKEYYLAPHLVFLDPFLKSRTSKGNLSAEESSVVGEEELSDHEDTNLNYDPLSPDNSSNRSSCSSAPSTTCSNSDGSESTNLMKAPEVPNPKENAFRKRKISATSTPSVNDVNQQVFQYFEKKKQILESQHSQNVTVPPDPDLAFLQSVLPDMKSMNDSQKRRFKIGILNLAEEILSTSSCSQSQSILKNDTLSPSNIASSPITDGSQTWTTVVNKNTPSTTQDMEAFTINEFILLKD